MALPYSVRRPAATEGETMSATKAALAAAPVRTSISIFDKCRKFNRIHELQKAGLYTYFRVIETGHNVVIDGHEVIMLGSNNYLGLILHPKVKERAIEATRKYGSGCSGSRFLNGTLDIHVELEERLATFMRKPACLIFSTGFLVNLGVLSSVAGKGDTIYLDRQDHACIYDGARLAIGADLKKFRHNDPNDLRRIVENSADKAGRSRGRWRLLNGRRHRTPS